jgi:hypothetical protein
MRTADNSLAFSEYFLLTSHIVENVPLNGPATGDQVMIARPRIALSKATGKIVTIYLSKSLILKLIYKGEPYDICPYKAYRTQLLRDVVTPTTDSQRKGLYFESRCLGLTASGAAVTDLPRTALGKKYVDQQRIDLAVDRFFRVAKEYDMLVSPDFIQWHKRVDVTDQFGTDSVRVFLDGTLDFISPVRVPDAYSYDAIVVDLKLTKDLDVCHPYKPSKEYTVTPWGCPDEMDFTEAVMYHRIFGLPFMYLVFDYKKDNASFKAIPIAVDTEDPNPQLRRKARNRHLEFDQTLRWTVQNILYWEGLGWPAEPSDTKCKRCPVADCLNRFKIREPQ